MGLGLDTTLIFGVVGIGYMINEASVQTAKIQYDNLPVALAKSNVTNSIAYSIWLNDLSKRTRHYLPRSGPAVTALEEEVRWARGRPRWGKQTDQYALSGSKMGSILFGGVDVQKYVGDMMSLNVTPADGTDIYDHFRIPLTSVEATSPSGSDALTTEEYPVPVVLDSGTTLSSLPVNLVEQMWEEVGAEFSDTLQQPLIPCYRRNSPGNFTFGFGGPDGPKITVPMDELILDIKFGDPPEFPDGSRYEGQDACMFGIHDFGGPPYILGGTFLRSAYVVFDIVNNQVGIAQTAFNETGSDIVPFPSNGAPIPSATAAPNQGETDTPATGDKPEFSAADGFQNSGGVPAALSVPAVLAAMSLAVLTAI